VGRAVNGRINLSASLADYSSSSESGILALTNCVISSFLLINSLVYCGDYALTVK